MELISRSYAFSKQRGLQGLTEVSLFPRALPGVPKGWVSPPHPGRGRGTGTARIPGAARSEPVTAWGSSSHAGKNTILDGGESVTPHESGIGCSRSLPAATAMPVCWGVRRQNDRPLLLPPRTSSPGCSAVLPASPFPFVLLPATLRNHSLRKHIFTMDWIEYIQASPQWKRYLLS